MHQYAHFHGAMLDIELYSVSSGNPDQDLSLDPILHLIEPFSENSITTYLLQLALVFFLSSDSNLI